MIFPAPDSPMLGAIVMALDTAWCVGLTAGILLGILNLLASHWTTRKALLLGEKHGEKNTVSVMILGFMFRLGLLALVILGVPEAWMNSTVFVLTFLAAFMAGVLMEARNVLTAKTGGAGPENFRNPPPPDSFQGGIEVEASR